MAKKPKTPPITERLRSRKLLIGFVVLASGVAIDLTVPRGLSDNLLTLLIAILGIYVTGNVGSKLASNLGTERPKVDTEKVEKKVAELEASQLQYDQYLNNLLGSMQSLQNQVAGIINRAPAPPTSTGYNE